MARKNIDKGKEMENLRNKYNAQIDAYHKITPQKGEPEASSFNIINEMHIDNKKMYENAHTRVLSAILKYDKSNDFLKSFLNRCGVSHNRVRIGNKDVIKVEPELQYQKVGTIWERCTTRNENEDISNCRPDCVIWKPQQFAIIVENKINGALETSGQVMNYINAISEDITIGLTNKDLIWVIYLGGDSEDLPSEISISTKSSGLTRSKMSLFLRGEGEDRHAGPHLRLVSYKNVIIPWLEEDVLPKCPFGETSLTGGLLVYIDYLKQKFECASTGEGAWNDSSALTNLFKGMEGEKPFIDRYQDARKYIGYANEDDDDFPFFNALRLFYLNHHFRFKESSLNLTWEISCRGYSVFIWKKSWSQGQAKTKKTGIVYFELYSYQIDKFLVESNYKNAITCSLKGNDGKFSALLKAKGLSMDKALFDAETKKNGRTLDLNREKGFFDTFVNDSSIKQVCEIIDKILNKYKKTMKSSQQ